MTQGFSLLETMVALSVFSMAAMGLLALNTQSVRIASELETRPLAQIVADNVATDTVTGKLEGASPVETGEEVQRRRAFVWTRTIESAPGTGLYTIRIDVAEPHNPHVLARLTLLSSEDTRQ